MVCQTAARASADTHERSAAVRQAARRGRSGYTDPLQRAHDRAAPAVIANRFRPRPNHLLTVRGDSRDRTGLQDGDSERAIAWRAADSLSLRAFLNLAPPAAPPDHSTISRTRRLFPVETHQAVFTWVLQQLADAGLVQGKTVGIDATTLEASSVRCPCSRPA